ncbi:IS21 family transposase, partial [Dyadobacter sp. CY312]|nr:IS21 family transposase [Dyadobacter sp. CY312]
PDKFAKACQIAIDNGIYSYRFIQKILENNMTDHQDEITQPQTLPAHHNIRGKDYYIQSTINFLQNEN